MALEAFPVYASFDATSIFFSLFSVVVILKYQLVSSLLVLERETKHTYTCIVPGNNMSTQFPFNVTNRVYDTDFNRFSQVFRGSIRAKAIIRYGIS